VKEYSIKQQCDDVSRHVSSRIHKIQNMYLSDGRGAAARQLALLRRAVEKEAGASPETWMIEFSGLPESLVGKGDRASIGETAVHLALTLYAVHQQSQNQKMHCPGREYDIGAAVRRYVLLTKGGAGLEDGELPRRFAAMSTAETIDEVGHNARQLIQLLRACSLPIDYGRFARQLLVFQVPSIRDSVRLEWGRGYAYATSSVGSKSDENDLSQQE